MPKTNIDIAGKRYIIKTDVAKQMFLIRKEDDICHRKPNLHGKKLCRRRWTL